MASRTSTVVAKGKGALIYHNNTSSAQLVTINAVANDGVSNPQISVLLDNSATNALNIEVSQYTLSSVPQRLIDIDIVGNGTSTSVLGNGQNGPSYLSNISGTNLSANGLDPESSIFIDPWFWIKPTEYGSPSDTTPYYLGWNSSNETGQWNDASGEVKETLLKGDLGTQDRQSSMTYYNRYMAWDQYTQTWIGTDTSGYMSVGIARAGSNNFDLANSSSNSMVYQIIQGSNPQSYPASGNYQVKNNPPFMSDGGVFTCTFKYPGQSYDHVGIMPLRGAFAAGTMPTDHSQTTATTVNGTSIGNFITTSASSTSRFKTQNGGFQWIKYNKATDKYYFCVKETSENNSGIWESSYETLTQNANATMGTTGGGPSNSNYLYQQSTWTRVAAYPVSITHNCSIPAKVGANLWLMHSLGDLTAYYSTDLKTWTNATSFISGGYIMTAQNATNVEYFVKSSGEVITVSTGLNEMSQAGLLEKKTAIGNFTRNGIVVNAGDAIYSDVDMASTTSVSFTVMDVSI